MSSVAARTLLGLSGLALAAGVSSAKSPPTDRLGVVDTLIHEIQGGGLVSPMVVQPRPRGGASARSPVELRMAWVDLGELIDASDSFWPPTMTRVPRLEIFSHPGRQAWAG